jgi:hypothetical protein
MEDGKDKLIKSEMEKKILTKSRESLECFENLY